MSNKIAGTSFSIYLNPSKKWMVDAALAQNRIENTQFPSLGEAYQWVQSEGRRKKPPVSVAFLEGQLVLTEPDFPHFINAISQLGIISVALLDVSSLEGLPLGLKTMLTENLNAGAQSFFERKK